jgi:valyl-tRNA synthetase
MAKLDEQIDELYQTPLGEFTAARNALAKESGDPAIKKLEKPSLPAWAVNQLFWRERKLYDEVIKTSGQMRTAYKQLLAGKSADVRAAEVFHAEAMRKAKDAIRRILDEAGNKGADAVMTPVSETLDALPTEDTPGRLTKPLRRTGFEALQGVTIAARPAAKATAGKPNAAVEKKSAAKKTPAEKETERQREKREADQQELAMTKERLRFADAAEREAEAALDRAKRSLERTERTRERIERELKEAAIAEKAAHKALAAAKDTYAKAQAEGKRLRAKIGG